MGSDLRIALDATTSMSGSLSGSAGGGISGVGVYARELLNGLAATDFCDRWEWYFRSPRFWASLRMAVPGNVTRRFLSDSWGARGADLFHGLNQRLPKRRFRRQVATFHDLFVLSGDYSSPEFRRRFEAQAREAAAGADLIIAVSGFTAGQLEEYLKVPAARIRVVHHGVLRRTVPALAREKVVLCAGAIQRRKNQAMLVRAFRTMPSGWTLVLAGSPGFGAEETMEEIARSPRAADIRVTGYLSDAGLADWYGRASIFAFPSRDEGFGMPVLEAMAAGIPVIAGGGSALPEVCGGAALLVDPEREDELAAGLLRLALDSGFRTELLALGTVRARQFTWSKAVSATAEVYGELV